MNHEDFLCLMRRRSYASIRETLLQEFRKSFDDDEECLLNLASTELRLGALAESIEHFLKLVALREWSIDEDYSELGAAYWLQSNSKEAIANWRQAVKCKYGDGAQNMTPALLLYYAGVRTDDESLVTEATQLIEKKLKTGWSKNWPAPLGRYLIEVADENHVEEQLAKEHPERQPDERCRFDFYRGVKEFQKGNNDQALAWMRSAVDHPDQVTWTTEFVLARHELGEIPK